MKTEKELRKTFVRQHSQSDCGVACLASIVNFYKGKTTLDHIRQVSGTTKFGTTLFGLHNAALALGLESKGLEAESIDNLRELSGPAILHVVLENKLQHYVVFYGFNESGLIIGDPEKGVEIWQREKLENIWHSKALLTLAPLASFKRGEIKERSYQWILDSIRDDASILTASLFLGILISVFSIATAIFSQQLIDNILPAKKISRLVFSLLLFGIILLIIAGLSYIRGLLLITQRKDFNNRILKQFYDALLNLPKSFFDSKKTGELLSRMNDTNRIQSVLNNVVGNILIESLMVIVSLAAVFGYSYQMGLIVLAAVPVYLLMLLKFKQPVITSQKEVMAAQALNEGNYIDTIAGIAEIKSYNKQRLFSTITTAAYHRFQKKIFDLGKIRIQLGFFMEMSGTLILMAIIGYCSYLVFRDVLKIGELVAILSLTVMIIPSLTKVALFNMQIQEAKVAFDRMREFTSLHPEKNEGKFNDLKFNEGLTIDNLSFHYPGAATLLENINLSITPKNLTMLLGESGSGKSTLLQIIQRFYEHQKGDIYYGTVNIKDIEVSTLREKVRVISQDIKIFNNYLLFNIALSEDSKEMARALNWCRKNGFDDYFQKFPQGYMTLLGEEGANISGGQRQLVAFARALFHNPAVLLIDEGTSAMDRNTENFILNLLHVKKKEMAILMVTHKIKTASRADIIYILEEGRIAQHGRPADLLKGNNFFSESYHDLFQYDNTMQ